MIKNKPKLSVIVIGYDMPRQLFNTAYSLSAHHQWNVSSDDYEVIVVENKSPHCANGEKIAALGHNVRYYLRDEKGVSPTPAINFALSKVRGDFVGLLIDGARMVTPRVIEYALLVQNFYLDSVYAVPGYFLGPYEHQDAESLGFYEQDEIKLLETIRWKENGYRLFDISCMSAANAKGSLQPFLECNCFFTSLRNFQSIGGADERFVLKGGGSINGYLFKTLSMLPQTHYYFVAPGEGSFHQQHGGVTTSSRADRDEDIKLFNEEIQRILGEPFRSFIREPIIIGSITSHAQRFFEYTSNRAIKRFERMTKNQENFWMDDALFPRWTNTKT